MPKVALAVLKALDMFKRNKKAKVMRARKGKMKGKSMKQSDVENCEDSLMGGDVEKLGRKQSSY